MNGYTLATTTEFFFKVHHFSSPRINKQLTDINVGINLNGCDGNAAMLEDDPEGGGDHALPNTRDHTARHQDVLHDPPCDATVTVRYSTGSRPGL